MTVGSSAGRPPSPRCFVIVGLMQRGPEEEEEEKEEKEEEAQPLLATRSEPRGRRQLRLEPVRSASASGQGSKMCHPRVIGPLDIPSSSITVLFGLAGVLGTQGGVGCRLFCEGHQQDCDGRPGSPAWRGHRR